MVHLPYLTGKWTPLVFLVFIYFTLSKIIWSVWEVSQYINIVKYGMNKSLWHLWGNLISSSGNLFAGIWISFCYEFPIGRSDCQVYWHLKWDDTSLEIQLPVLPYPTALMAFIFLFKRNKRHQAPFTVHLAPFYARPRHFESSRPVFHFQIYYWKPCNNDSNKIVIIFTDLNY